MTHSLASRTAATALLALTLVSTGASTASARPDPIDVRSAATGTSAMGCALQRIGTQLVRCDNYTGAGVPAPLFIPERQLVPPAGAR
jgi:hypothetical protein